jgi:sugar phosphate isomerase/epimerase
VRLGLYSITYLGVWYRGPALTVEQLIDRARQVGYEGVEIDGKRPHANPADWPAARCRQVRQYASDAGVEIYAVAANNDFSSPIPEHRESQLAYVSFGWPRTSEPVRCGCLRHGRA